MRVDANTMKRRQRPRIRGSWVCEFRGLGMLPVLHTGYLDMKSRTYSQSKKGDRRSAKFQQLLKAYEKSGGLVAIQIDHHKNDGHDFKEWWGIVQTSDLVVTEDGSITLDVVDRLLEWPD
ncbi:MAG: hypothetical protein NXH80_16490 [Rhodobacteraceae bacterium]|nr:hypothetical protein [Paracoccaceae bacterium]